jgi:SLT domain-containing protein
MIEAIILYAVLKDNPEIIESRERERVIARATRTGDFRAFARAHYNKKQWKCLDELWQRESSWGTIKNPHLAKNPKSSAYGIPQATKGKMAEQAADWKTNPITQIKWGMNYIKQRYKTPCNALQFHDKKNWY